VDVGDETTYLGLRMGVFKMQMDGIIGETSSIVGLE
jgi:hypothetical protein